MAARVLASVSAVEDQARELAAEAVPVLAVERAQVALAEARVSAVLAEQVVPGAAEAVQADRLMREVFGTRVRVVEVAPVLAGEGRVAAASAAELVSGPEAVRVAALAVEVQESGVVGLAGPADRAADLVGAVVPEAVQAEAVQAEGVQAEGVQAEEPVAAAPGQEPADPEQVSGVVEQALAEVAAQEGQAGEAALLG